MVTAKKRARGPRPPDPYDIAARIGNDDPHLESQGVAYGKIAGHTMALPERVRKNATEEQKRALAHTFGLVEQHVQVLEQLDHSVAELRRLKLSWETIAWVVGLTAAGARKRWAER